MKSLFTLRAAFTLALLPACLTAHAFDQKWSGFGSIVAGRTFGTCNEGTMTDRFNDNCTRYIADWGHAGVYTPQTSLQPESRLGVQWTGNFTDSLSATVQGMGRLTDGNKVDLEWAYLTDKIDSSWTVQVGRKRLPLYYYSDFQDAGYAYTMIRPSPDVYGWDVVNYNGANVDWSGDFGDWSVHASVYGGGEDSRKNKYSMLVSDSPLDVHWNDIIGTSVEANYDWLTLRASYTQSKIHITDHDSGEIQPMGNGSNVGRQSFYGIAAIVDQGDWLLRAELAAANRGDQDYKAKFFYLAAGRRFGDFTPMLQVSQYYETPTNDDGYIPEHNRTYTGLVRYEVTKSSDLKLQVDRDVDHTAVRYTGSAWVVSASYDFVF